jgi:hypothetical protein
VPYKVPKNNLDSSHVKANLLLQSHFERCPMPILDYIADMKSALDHASRVMQGMLDFSCFQGYLDTSLNMVYMMQMAT